MSNVPDDNYDFGGLLERFPGVNHGAKTNEAPRYHLFHAPNSICSQKVRATLFALNDPFVSHNINIFAGENFDKVYVRTRVYGCKEAGLPLSSFHLGGSSAEMTGCDACVVPTVINRKTRKVIVDSHRICMSINSERHADAPSLMPDEFKQAVKDELAIVDMLPNYPLLASAMAKAQNVEVGENAYSRAKLARCEALMRANADDPDLLAAYTAKRDKDRSASSRLFTEEAVSHSYQEMKRAFENLDQRLNKSKGVYLFGSELTLADLFWSTELFRAEDLQLDSIWADGRLPALAEYFSRLADLPALKQAIIDWPGARFSFSRH